MATIVSLVAAGAGVSLMPCSVEAIGRTDVHCVPLVEPPVNSFVAMAWPRGDSPAALPPLLDIIRSIARN